MCERAARGTCKLLCGASRRRHRRVCGDATARSSFDGEGRSKLANKRRVAVLGDDAVLLVTPPPALTDGKAAHSVLGRENAGSDLV